MASDLHRLETDLPTSSEDVRALRQARDGAAMTPAQIVHALDQLGHPSAAELRARRGPRGEPFTLSAGAHR